MVRQLLRALLRGRVSRPCYDKVRRCPGWAGGGERYARVQTCDGGMLPWEIYYRRLWKWRTNRCPWCGLLVLPYMIRYVDPGHYKANIKYRISLWIWTRKQRREQRR